MSLALEQIKAATLGGTLAREMARIEEERSSWRKALIDTDLIGKQVRELAEHSAYAQMAKELKALQSPAMSIAKQYQDLLGPGSAIGSAFKAWQESERAQMEQMRRMLEPLAEVRKSFMLDQSARQLIKDATLGANAWRDQLKEAMSGLTGVGSVAKMWAQQIEQTQAQTRSAFESLKLGSALSQQLKDFEYINKQWRVSPELLGVVGSLKELQAQIGKVAIPTIDWGSAAALAKLLGEEGLQEQLAHLGIAPDGSLHESKEAPEKGLLSRKQSDAVALVGLLLAIIGIWMSLQMFYHQENAGAEQQAKNDEQAAKQMRQLESLSHLVEQALEQAAKAQEERFVVRERPATVRSKPEHGSAVEGKLMPNEVVRAIDKDGKWVEIEYYHWLREEYRTGWVLKKYLDRVPLNYQNKAP